MSKPADAAGWPPDSLPEYYKSDAFLKHLRTLQRRLQRTYANVEAEIVVFDAAADLLVKEIQQQCVYDKFLHRFPTERHFLRYLYEACCRKVIDQARSFQRKFRQLLDPDDVQDSRSGPEDSAMESEEQARSVRLVKDLEKSVISKLPKIDQLVLNYRLAGRSFPEIAELLELGVATVHRRYKAVISKLAAQLESQGEGQKIRPTR